MWRGDAIASTRLALPVNRVPMAASETVLPAPINAISTRLGLIVGFLGAEGHSLCKEPATYCTFSKVLLGFLVLTTHTARQT